ncbi:hypothetical protein HMPREF9990_09185 [Staphylococcus epidermidis NIHLM061]|nr:hypothetical protein HMPREF9990_09185 [Staphylococcus epidermidis NIHLM061]EJD98941.1 hypothetical protein HMPREF9988_00818 [Staphylococcus epidermidis NIHLM053]
MKSQIMSINVEQAVRNIEELFPKYAHPDDN